MTNNSSLASVPLDHGDSVDAPFELFADSVVDGCIVDRFEAIARRFPNRLAIQDAAVLMTYAELAALVHRISAATIAATEGRIGPVALLVPVNANLPAAMLGILAAGRAYVALDRDLPAERNSMIMADASACAVITSGDLVSDVRASFPPDIPVIDVQKISQSVSLQRNPRPVPDDIATICYTSGSSGVPKGIAWSHRNLLHWVRVFTNTARVTCADRTLLLFSASISASYRSIYCALLNGASVHILSPLCLGLAELVQQIRDRRITIYHSVPTLLRRIAERVEAGARLESVRIVCIGGDRVRWGDVDECRRIFCPHVLVQTILSSTETGAYLQAFVDDSLRSTTAQPPVGRAASGWNVKIAGEDGEPVPDGTTGEIVVASRFIALGYWRGSDRQVDAFPADPADPKARVFATGDLGRRRPDGLIEFVGRNDQQVKLHGHRIEPAEVESAMTALPVVSDAAVVVRRNEAGVAFAFVAYAVLRPGIRGLLPRHLQGMLAQCLPRYLVPSRIYVLGELPRLPNDKIDRRTLARLDADTCGSPRHRSADPLAAEITRIFERTVGFEGATPDDTVASLGGDSLQAVSLVAELERRYAISMPDAFIEQHPTIHQVAHWIASRIVQRTNQSRSK